MNNRGNIEGSLLMIVSIAAFAIFILIVGYIGNTVATEMKDQVNSTNEDVNAAFDRSITTSTTTLSTLWYIVFAGLLLGVFVTAWFMRELPILIPIYLIMLVCAIIIGAAMSNAYEALTDVATLSTASAQQQGVAFFMFNLPYVALVIGLIALVLAFAKPDSVGGSALG